MWPFGSLGFLTAHWWQRQSETPQVSIACHVWTQQAGSRRYVQQLTLPGIAKLLPIAHPRCLFSYHNYSFFSTLLFLSVCSFLAVPRIELRPLYSQGWAMSLARSLSSFSLCQHCYHLPSMFSSPCGSILREVDFTVSKTEPEIYL